jgi:hypothetical protein
MKVLSVNVKAHQVAISIKSHSQKKPFKYPNRSHKKV